MKYYVNKNLTRKLGVRKFLNDILKSFILRMENRQYQKNSYICLIMVLTMKVSIFLVLIFIIMMVLLE